jgi:hypothetical protein
LDALRITQKPPLQLENDMTDSDRTETEASTAAIRANGPKHPFEEPRLAFVEPKLTPRGDLREVTAGFVGSFSP